MEERKLGMGFLYNRRLAVVLTLLIVLAAAFGGANRTLSEMEREVSRVFYSGENGDGLSIQNDLEERMDLAYNLVTVARRYMQDDSYEVKQVLEAREELEEALYPSEQYRANNRLTEATTDLAKSMEALELTDADKKYQSRLTADLNARNDTISHDPYNRLAGDFNAKLDRFPANFLAKLCGVEKAVLYQ